MWHVYLFAFLGRANVDGTLYFNPFHWIPSRHHAALGARAKTRHGSDRDADNAEQ